jgi:hypothetical protein
MPGKVDKWCWQIRSYNEGNFEEVILYCRGVLHTFSWNYSISIWHLLIRGTPVIILPHIWGQILRNEFVKIICICEDHVSVPQIFWQKTVAVYFPTYMGPIHKNSYTPRDHICGHKFSNRKQFLSCMQPPFLMNNSMYVIFKLISHCIQCLCHDHMQCNETGRSGQWCIFCKHM